MSLKETLALFITCDSSGAVKALEKTGATADKELGRTEDRIAAMGKKMTSVGAGMVATGGLLVAGFAAAAFASEDADKSVIKLENSINGNAKIAQGASQEFQDLAKSIQKKTAADGDAIVSGQSVLVQMGATTDQVKTLTPLAVDLAQKLGIDMDTAFKMVGKSINGSAGALKKAGVVVDETKFKTDAYGATVDALAASVGGFAEEEGQTFSGTLARLKNEMGDLEESVGKGAAGAFKDMLTPVINLTDAMTELDPKLLETIGRFGAFGAVGITAAGGLLMVAGQIAKLAPLMKTTTGEGDAMTTKMSGLGKSVVVIGVAMGVASLATEAWAQHAGTLTIDLKKMGDVTDQNLDKIIKWSAAVGTAAAGGAKEFGKQMAESSIPQALRFADAMERNGINTDAFKKGIDETKTSLAKAQVSQEGHADAIDAEAKILEEKAIPTLKEYQDSLKAAEDAQRGLTDSIKAATDPWFAALDAMNQNREAGWKVTEAQKAYTDAINEFGRSSPEATKAQRDLEAAQIDSAKSAGDVDVQMHNLMVSVQNGKTSVADMTTILNGWVQQGLITQTTADGMITKLTGVGNTAAGLDGTSITISMTLDMSQAQARLNRFISDNGAFAIAAREGRAGGGPVRANQAYVVGEQGPELFVPNSGGTVVPNGGGTPSSGGSGGVNVYLTVQGSLLHSGQDVLTAVEEAARRGMTVGNATRKAFAR